MSNHPKTTIWRKSPDGLILISERPGLPSPIPKIEQPIFIEGIGQTTCFGLKRSGSDNEIIEVQLKVR